jgi:hypothetical protein
MRAIARIIARGAVIILALVSLAAPAVPWPTIVCSTTHPQYEPAIAPIVAKGGAFVAYPAVVGSDPVAAFGAYLDESGTVSPSCGQAMINLGSITRVSPDGLGGYIVAAVKGSGQDIYAERRDAAGNILWGLGGAGKPACTATGDQGFALETFGAVAPDGLGGCYIVWQDLRAGGTEFDIYIQRLTASAGNVASGWDANGKQLSGLSGQTGSQTYASVIPDGSHGAIVVWQHVPTNGLNADIMAARVDSSGNLVTGWTTANGIPVCNASNDQVTPTIATDDSGGAIISWEDGRTSDVYAMRMLTTGSPDPRWTANGVPLTGASLQQMEPETVADGYGGAIVAWTDNRNTMTDPDVYTQRISRDGQILWTIDGVPVSVAALDQAHPRIVSDNAGGAVICWDDFRNGATDLDDVYAQRVWQGGSVLWTADGVQIGGGSGNQNSPAIASDGYGGAVIAWRDDAADIANPDVKVTRVLGSGVVGGVTAVGEALVLGTGLAISPNPASTSVEFAFREAGAKEMHLAVFDLGGRCVRKLEAAGRSPASIRWNLKDASGKRVAPGLYWVRGQAGGKQVNSTLVVLK